MDGNKDEIETVAAESKDVKLIKNNVGVQKLMKRKMPSNEALKTLQMEIQL